MVGTKKTMSACLYSRFTSKTITVATVPNPGNIPNTYIHNEKELRDDF